MTVQNLKLKKGISYLIMLLLFLLPWQTRWIYQPAYLNGYFWEYGTLSLYGTEILMWLIILLFAADNFRRKEFWTILFGSQKIKERRKWLLFVLMFSCLNVLLIFHSVDWQISYQYVSRLLGAVCLFFVIARSETTKQSLGMATAFWFGGVMQGLLAIWQFFTQYISPNKWLGIAEHFPAQLGASVIETGSERWLRAYGSFGSPNALGIYLAVMLVLGMMVYIKHRATTPAPLLLKEGAVNNLFVIGQSIILSGLILSFSRGAWLAAAVGILFIFFINKQNRLEIGKNILYNFLLFISFFIILNPLFLTRVDTSARLEQKSIAERKTQWQEFGQVFSNHRLFGTGPGAYTAALHQLSPSYSAGHYQPVHNIYLLILAEWGVLGMGCWALLYFYVFKLFLENNSTILPALAVLLAAGLFDHWLLSMFTGVILWWVIIGLTGRLRSA